MSPEFWSIRDFGEGSEVSGVTGLSSVFGNSGEFITFKGRWDKANDETAVTSGY